MAKSHSIPPFSSHLDRDAFGHWLSGFCDGEGCFTLAWNSNHRRPATGSARFGIKLRRDDRSILEEIQAYWNCGSVFDAAEKSSTRNSNPCAKFHIQNLADLAEIVVPHFERYPLRAKKARDFVIWKDGVEILSSIRQRHTSKYPNRRPHRRTGGRRGLNPRWTPADMEYFQSLCDHLRSVRAFDSSLTLDVKPEPPKPASPQLFLFGT